MSDTNLFQSFGQDKKNVLFSQNYIHYFQSQIRYLYSSPNGTKTFHYLWNLIFGQIVNDKKTQNILNSFNTKSYTEPYHTTHVEQNGFMGVTPLSRDTGT